MAHHIWHAFYYDRSGAGVPPCRSEVIEAESNEAATRVARNHLGGCARVSLESARWISPWKTTVHAAEVPVPTPRYH